MRLTERAIMKKVNRKRNPVTSLVQLAHEFGVNTTYTRRSGKLGNTAPKSFRRAVLKAVGHKAYNKIRDNSHVRVA